MPLLRPRIREEQVHRGEARARQELRQNLGCVALDHANVRGAGTLEEQQQVTDAWLVHFDA